MKPWILAGLVCPAASSFLYSNNSNQTLLPFVFTPLPVGSITPRGWLQSEMMTMANGLAGHEHEFYIFVSNSRWLQSSGGTDYSNLNEALPYWFNGLVPLAYSLNDARLKDQVHSVASTVLGLQSSDGWIGPEIPAERNFWGRTPFFLGLTQLAEANTTWERPVVKALDRFMVLTNSMLHNSSFGFSRCASTIDCRWGQVRVADMILTIQWLLDRHKTGPSLTSVLWDNMQLFNDQTQYKWTDWYQPGTYPEVVADPTPSNPQFPYMHGVNVGQGLKSSVVMRRFTKDDSLLNASFVAVNWTFTYHGAPSGTILADEIMRDLNPYMGSELCTAVETAYSMAYMYQATGNYDYADRAELAIFNALPVMLTADMWAHQYMDEPNQPWAWNNSDGVFTTSNSGVATSFGMEPEYPCCTVNHPQGYPKFLTHSWATTSTGLAHMLLGPSTVTASLLGHTVTVVCNTNYPFDNTLKYTIIADAAFDLSLRVPGWSNPSTSSIIVNGTKSDLNPDSTTRMQKVHLQGGITTITYTLSADIRTVYRQNNAVSVYVGNLLYALDVGSANISTLPHAYGDPHGSVITDLPYPQLRDYYLYNTSAWNIAIDINTLVYHPLNSSSTPGTLTSGVFDYYTTPTWISVKGCQIPWNLYKGKVPDAVPAATAGTCRPGTVKEYTLIPYGAAKIHMSELPTVDLSGLDVRDEKEDAFKVQGRFDG